MRSTGRLLAAVAIAIAAATVAWTLGAGARRDEIERAEAHARQLEHQRDSLLVAIGGRDSLQAVLVHERGQLDSAAARLRDSVRLLDSARAEARLTVRAIRTVGALQARLRAAFPQLGRSGWGLTSIPIDRRDTVGIQYLLVPAWFAETFVIDRANAKSWRAQKDKLLAVDSLRLAVSALQDSVTRLVSANADAYRTGYQAAYTGYQDVSRHYVKELKKPRFGFGSTIGLLAAAGAGVVIGGAVR